jgi:dTDP-4-dehydrorhamnose 3,5-epimerase-like enzyme
MGRTPLKTRRILFLFLGVFVVLTFTSTYLYRENKSYQHENRRLLILNDSILSVNIELKGQLQQKGTATIGTIDENVKTKKNK